MFNVNREYYFFTSILRWVYFLISTSHAWNSGLDIYGKACHYNNIIFLFPFSFSIF